MKIRSILLASFAAILIPFGIIGFIEQRTAYELAASFQAMDTKRVPALTDLLELITATQHATIKSMEYSMWGETEDRARARKALARIHKHLQGYLTTQQTLDAKTRNDLSLHAERFRTLVEDYLTSADGPAIQQIFSGEEVLHKTRSSLIRQIDSTIPLAVDASSKYDLLTLKSEARKVSIKIIEYSLRGNTQDREKAIQAMDELRAAHLRLAPNGPDSAEVSQQVDQYLHAAKDFLQRMSSRHRSIQNIHDRERALHTARMDFTGLLHPLIANQYATLGATADATKAHISHTNLLHLISLFAIALVTLLLSFLLTRSITKPLEKLSTIVRRSGQGEAVAAEDLPIKGSAELQQLSRSVAMMMERQNQLTSSLKAKEADLRMLLDTSPTGLALTRMDGTLVEVNSAYAAIVGRSVEETRGLTYWDLTPAEYNDIEELQLRELEQTGAYGPYEKEYLHKQGYRIPVRLSGRRIELEGEPHIWSVVEDITKQRRAERELSRQLSELRQTKSQLSEAQRISHLGNWNLDLTSDELSWSDEIYRIFELDKEAFPATYEGFLQVIHPDDLEMVNRAYTQSVQDKTSYHIVHRLLMPDGRIKYVRERCETFYDDRGKPLRSSGTVQDITEQYEAQQALLKNEAKLSLLLNTLPNGVQENDTSGVITYSNLAHHQILGYEPGELIGCHIWDREKDDQKKQALRDYLAYLIEAQPDPEPYVTCNITKDGREVTLEITWDYQRDIKGAVSGFISIISDITERQQTEQQLQESEAFLREAQRLAHLGNWNLDLSSGQATWSDEEFRLLGYAPGAVMASAENFMSAVHPDDIGLVQAAMEASMRPDNPEPYHIQHRVLGPDGQERVLDERGNVDFDSEGRPLRMFGTTQDITEQVRIQRELDQHRLHLEELVRQRTETIRRQAQIIDQTHDSVVTTDLDGFVTGWNGGAERLFGIPASEAMDRHISFIYPEDQHEFLAQQVITPLKTQGQHETEVRMLRADGSEFTALLSLSLLYDDEDKPRGMVGYSVDLTELKQREIELKHLTNRLKSANRELESFAYSVSHDLRAPLRAIDGFSLALAEDYGEQLDETAHDYLQRVRNGAQRMGLLIDDLLQLSRVNRIDLIPEKVDLAVLARAVMEELQAGEPKRKVELILGEEMEVEGDSRLLRVMLDNLLGNAWKFTANEPTSQIIFKQKTDTPGLFYISDNGVGFDMRHAGKLFAPFQRLHRTVEFAGTGVGLATVQRIINRHGGQVWAEATVGEGASFYFTLGSTKDLR
jgi:PAS domain S-box-containing protein